jgi:hypothetical protein
MTNAISPVAVRAHRCTAEFQLANVRCGSKAPDQYATRRRGMSASR